VFPVVQITVNGVAEPLCQYPNNVSITQTTSVTVNNPRGTLLEYVTTCSLSLFAGNNTIGFQIVGGQGHGGLLTVRHILVYKTSGITGNAACYENVGGHINYFTTTLTAADLFTLQTNELNWKAATCGGSIQGSWMNLRTGFFIFAQGCNGSQACALTQMN
jgi:hypothetical protein